MTKNNYKVIEDIRELLTDSSIDEEVRELLIQLNQAGLRTTSSCTGHGENILAFVSFAKSLAPQEAEQAIRIARQLDYHPYLITQSGARGPHTVMYFGSYGHAISVKRRQLAYRRTK